MSHVCSLIWQVYILVIALVQFQQKHVHVCAAPMPRLTVFNHEYQGGTRQGAQGGWDSGPKWMEEVKDGVEGEALERRKLQRYVQ